MNNTDDMSEQVTLEIETTTVLTGPLAERLVQLAADTGKTPVDLMADIIERSLAGAKTYRVAQAEARGLRNEIAILRRRLETAQGPVLPKAFEEEAAKRGITADGLAKTVLDLIAGDNLFAAVLDG